MIDMGVFENRLLQFFPFSRDRLRKQHVHSSSPCHTLHSLCRLLPLFSHVWTSNLVFVLSPHLSPHHFLVALALQLWMFILGFILVALIIGILIWLFAKSSACEMPPWNPSGLSVEGLSRLSVCHSLSPLSGRAGPKRRLGLN